MSNPHIYLFHGTDSYSIAKKTAVWKAEFGKKYGGENCSVIDCESLGKECDTLGLVSQLVHTATLFSTTKLVIVCNLFSKATPKQLLDAFAHELESVPPTHFLVFCDEKLDSRTTFAKTVHVLVDAGRAQIQEFETPRGHDLAAWVRQYLRGINAQMESGAILELVNRFDPPSAIEREKWQKEKEKPNWDLWAVVNELEKLIAYAQGRAIVRDDVRLLTRENADAHVFALVDALCSGGKKGARALSGQLIGSGSEEKSSAISMISLLASQFRHFVIVKERAEKGESNEKIAEKLGWKPQRLWVVSKKIKGLSMEQLRRLYRALLDADAQLKSTALDPLLLFERVLATF